jgi:hypothetical protein
MVMVEEKQRLDTWHELEILRRELQTNLTCITGIITLLAIRPLCYVVTALGDQSQFVRCNSTMMVKDLTKPIQ